MGQSTKSNSRPLPSPWAMHRQAGGDNMRFMKKILFVLVALVMVSGYLPDKSPGNTQPAQ